MLKRDRARPWSGCSFKRFSVQSELEGADIKVTQTVSWLVFQARTHSELDIGWQHQKMHSLKYYLLSSYYVLGRVLGVEEF